MVAPPANESLQRRDNSRNMKTSCTRLVICLFVILVVDCFKQTFSSHPIHQGAMGVSPLLPSHVESVKETSSLSRNSNYMLLVYMVDMLVVVVIDIFSRK